MNNSTTYPTTAAPERTEVQRFFFESLGHQTITKAVEYTQVATLEGRRVFNLGFGDYDPATGDVLDSVNSNNGDVYKVFNTVLDTVLRFYKSNSTGIIFVQGSDSSEDHEAVCRVSCARSCGERCRNVDRRISTYRNFVNRNFEALDLEYRFFGRMSNNEPFKPYEKGIEYKSLLVYKR